MIPNQLKKDKYKFCLIRKQSKAPFEKEWQKKGYKYNDQLLLKHLAENGNYGVIGGYGNLRILDVDDKKLIPYFEKGFERTFMVKTGSGGLHIYFESEYNKNHVFINESGEFRASNYQVVGAGSIHPNGKRYEQYNNKSIKTYTPKEIQEIITPFVKEKGDTPEQTILDKDTSGSGLEYRRVLAMIRNGLGKEEIFKEMNKYAKWKNHGAKFPQYREETYNKALIFNTKENEQIVDKRKVDLRRFSDLFKIKKDKSFLVQDVIYPKSVTMLFSPPGQFKSLLGFLMAMCIASGKPWLKFKTRKNAVLLCDAENNDQILKERAEMLYKGHALRRKKIPLFLLKGGLLMDSKKNINLVFLENLEQIIQENKIKLIIFDTMHRFAYYDENSSDDINKLYTKVFQPLRDKYGVSIVFLHHTTKAGDYRGSGDFLGMVDTSYKVMRIKNTDKFYIYNEKARGGEIDKITGEIDFNEDYIKIIRMKEDEELRSKITKLKDITERIKFMFRAQSEFQLKDVLTHFEIENYDFGSKRQVQRCLKFLVENEYIDYDKRKRRYIRLNK